MSKKVQRIIVIVLAAALLLTVIVPALSLIAGATVTQSDIDSLKGNLNDIAQRRKDNQAKLDSIRSDLAQAKAAVELVQEQVLLTEQQISYQQQLIDATPAQIDATQAQIDASQAQIEAYDGEIARKTADIHDLEEQEARQYQEFYDQVRWMEETGNASYLSILFEASSFAEMLDYAVIIADIMDYSNRIIDRLEATQAELAAARTALQADRDAQAQVKLLQEGQKAEQEAQKAEQEAQMAELGKQKAQLEKDKADAVALKNKIAASESAYAKEAAALAAEEAAIEKALKEAEKKYAEQLAALQNNGEWYWPLPGKTSLSSLFGGRYHPITHLWHSHTGTDIPAAAGTEIHAAQDGVVTYVSPNKNGSYGWYCMITHANGYVTLYAHQRVKPIVKEGQTVKKGQVVGYVGTTGSSTGNHLHFEVRVNGVRKDALSLYPNMTFTYSGYSWKGANYPKALNRTS